MNNKNPFKLNWRSTLGFVVIGLGTMGIATIPAAAFPIKSEIKLSQVGIRSDITSPTPLNLRPRTHIPSPPSNYSNYSKYHHRDRRYEGCSYYENCRHPHPRRTHRKRSRGNTTIIIINSDNHRTYSNYRDNGYIRVIKK